MCLDKVGRYATDSSASEVSARSFPVVLIEFSTSMMFWVFSWRHFAEIIDSQQYDVLYHTTSITTDMTSKFGTNINVIPYSKHKKLRQYCYEMKVEMDHAIICYQSITAYLPRLYEG